MAKFEAEQTLVDRLMSANGNEIRDRREALGWSQAELAARSGTNQQTIDRIERGLTKQSKFVPEIRAALKLPMLPEQAGENLIRFLGEYGALRGIRARLIGNHGNEGSIPVYGLDEEDGTWVLSQDPLYSLPRSYPVENAMEAYGVVVPDDLMAPSLRQGEVAVINPDQSAEWGREVLALRALPDGRYAGMFRAWAGGPNTGAADEMWTFRTWNPPREEQVRFLFWPVMGAVVAKLPGRN